jgi:hypothetical protein
LATTPAAPLTTPSESPENRASETLLSGKPGSDGCCGCGNDMIFIRLFMAYPFVLWQLYKWLIG